MSRSTHDRSPETSEDARKLGKWARRYAQNRSLGMVAFLLIFLTLYLMMAGFPILAVLAYRGEHWIPFGICIAMIVVAMAATLYLSVPRWGGKLIEGLNDRMYAKDGSVRLAPPLSRTRKRIGIVLAVAFGACILGSVGLSARSDIPEKYMQPISAIYCIPFLVGIWLLQSASIQSDHPALAALYGLHAILIVAGAPIVFAGRWSSLNMLMPVVGYGLLVALIGHAYSRFALRKLRDAADGCGDESAEESDE